MDRDELARIFPLASDSLPQPNVPKGRVEQHAFNASRIFPGTERDYWIYVPAQYRASHPACLLVVQDGGQHLHGGRWDMATVLDNLIHQGAMPVTIGVFVNPGQVPARRAGAVPRNHRSFEYDSTNDRYVRFLLEELLPEVEQRYRLRPEGNSRAIMGGSSGGVCALNAAWERPDRFQRVISNVGSFTNMRGGHTLAARVRLTEPKPLKVFLQGGAQDLDVAVGHWWTANLEMLAALEYAGYDVAHVWDERAGHNEFHCTMVCPEALRWVWQDWPKPVRAGRPSRQPVAQVLAPQKRWQPVAASVRNATVLAADPKGRLCWAEAGDGTVRRLETNGRTTVLARGVAGVTGLAFESTGALLMAQTGAKRVVRLAGNRPLEVLASGIAARGICAAQDGGIYLSEPGRNRVWWLAPDGKRRVVLREVEAPQQLALTADGGGLLIAAAGANDVWLTTVAEDGGLLNAEPCFHLSREEGAAVLEVVAMTAVHSGWLCLATRAGLQLNIPNGTVTGFVPLPVRGEPLTGMTLAGPKRDQLYVSCGGRILRRKIRRVQSLWLF